MNGRHVRRTPEQIRRVYRLAAQRKFDQIGLPRGLRKF